jgi:hypothetical protein
MEELCHGEDKLVQNGQKNLKKPIIDTGLTLQGKKPIG